MQFFNLQARITEEDLSGVNRITRQPVYLYIEAQTDSAMVLLKRSLEEFLAAIMDDPTLKASAEVEICIFGQNGSSLVKECGAVTDTRIVLPSQIIPTNGQRIHLTPILKNALDRIAAQKLEYKSKNISYGKPALLLFTAGKLADEPWQLQEVVSRPLRETSVDILPVSENSDESILKLISSKDMVLHVPVEQAYTEVFREIRNSMERLSRSTTATYQELMSCLVDGSKFFN
jgi:uncharacterized protein YegL